MAGIGDAINRYKGHFTVLNTWPSFTDFSMCGSSLSPLCSKGYMASTSGRRDHLCDSSFFFFYWMRKCLEPKFDESGNITPEARLPAACVGGFALPICLFWFGWTSRPSFHWIVPIIGSGWFSIGALLLFLSIMNYLSDAYPE